MGLGGVVLLPACHNIPRAQDMPDADPPAAMKIQTHGNGPSLVVEVRWAETVDPWGQVSAPKVEMMIRNRLQLGVIDALVGVCEGGPGPADPAHVFRYGGILIGRDPVTLDRRGWVIIEAWRARLGLVPLSQRTKPNLSPPIHIDNAAALGVRLT